MKKFVLIISIILLSSIKLTALHCIINPTIDLYFKDKWFNTLGANIPRISTANQVFPEQKFIVTVLCADYAVKDSLLNLRYSIKITDPEGEIFVSKDSLLLSNRKVYNPDYVMMGEEVGAFSFTKSQLRGEYKIEIVVHDLISNENAENQTTLELIDLPSLSEIPAVSEEENEKWIHNYYNVLNPETLYKRFIQFINSEHGNDLQIYSKIVTFYAKLLQDNPFIFAQIEDEFPKLNKSEKFRTLDLLLYSNIECESFIESLNEEEIAYWKEISSIERLNPFDEITTPVQQDLLWIQFFATGSIEPIKHLITTLDFPDYTEKQIQNLPEDEKMKFALFYAATWSLKSNCKQHILVFNYCQWIYMNMDLTETQKKNILSIVYLVAEEMKAE